jgi:ATP-dependent Clp protease ATP-binding subunit ClpB
MEKYINLETILHHQVIGQDDAINAVSNAIRRNKTGIGDEMRPLGSFLFAGPTGVGKTELAKVLASFLFDDIKALTRIDMSEYMEKYSVSRLIGAPPGYVGYDQGGQLTEVVRRRPYSVILFDEIEKAHPDIFNTLLQLLDDGRLTDSKGRTVDFKNTIIILTSNIGSEYLLRNDEDAHKEVQNLVKKTFKPEFLNRIDEQIIFNPLGLKVQIEIALKMLNDLKKRLSEKNININFDETIQKYVIKHGYNDEYGARPLKRFIQRHIETLIATKIIEGSLEPYQNYLLTVKDDQLTLEKDK